MKVSLSSGCGNSPKNKFAQDFAVALERGDMEFLASAATDDVHWDLVGSAAIEGRTSLLERISDFKPTARALEVDRVLTHGRSGAVNGTLTYSGKTRRSFCHILEFASAKGAAVKGITSYVVDR